MANHNPTITSSNATGSFSEDPNTTGSTALHQLSGTMNFSDSDRNDTHTTSATLKTAVLSSGTIIPSTTLAHLSSALSSSILTDSNGSGKLKWSFSAEDNDFDFLSKNQKLTLTYQITLSDNHGGSTTKTVTVTVTGTDDKPVIDFGTTAFVTEQAGQTLSLTPDTVHVAVHFVDPDLTNTGHTATVVGASAAGNTSGLLPGSLGTAELMSFFHIDNVVKTSGSSNGTINTTFSAPDLAFDYLAQGETLDITYTLQIDDHAGGVTTQTVMVTVIGTNDAPIYLSGPDVAHLTEGQDLSPSGDLTAQGDLCFTDIDLADTHVAAATSVTATRSGGGAIPLTEAQLLAALTASVEDSTGHLLGQVDWSFALDNDAVSFLSAGETLTLTYQVTVTDDAGGSASQTVTVTILGTNHPVVITSGPEAASLTEFVDTTGSSAPNSTSPVPTGSLAFSDQDTGDTHTVNVTVDSAVWSAGGAVPAATQGDLAAALQTTLNDSTGTGSGSVDWTFSIADQDLDFLAAGETLTITYDVEVRDGSTGSTQTVTITASGENDAVVMTDGPGAGAVAEQPNTTGSATPDTASGTLAFADVDLNDVHSAGAVLTSFVWSTGGEIPGVTQTDLMSALSTVVNDSIGSGAGSVQWTFSLADADLDFLAAGDTLIVTYDVTVSDGFTTSTQTVTITATGAADSLIVNPVTNTIVDSANQDDGQIVALGNLITDGPSSAGDGDVTLSVTDVNGSAANVNSFIAGAFGSLIVFADGSYFYLADANLDSLQVGEDATDEFTFTITDSLGRSESSTLTFNVSGGDDAPVITGGFASGTVTEDLGPITIVNGGFETGDLTGWSPSNASAQFLALGGQFGNYSAKLETGAASLSQDVATVSGTHYTVSFYVIGDPESSSNSLQVSWGGSTLLVATDLFGGITHYTFDVVGDPSSATTALTFTSTDDGPGLYVDQIIVSADTAPATESTSGNITFSDIETGDTHTASFMPQDGGYVGTFTLDPVSESGGSGSVGWHFTVDNADIQFLAQDQVLTQTYTVFITDDHGVSSAQNVTVALVGTNDAPTAVGETIITDVGAGGTVDIPAWALGINDIDPDAPDVLTPDVITSSSGGSAFLFGDAFFQDDPTLGGSFDYTVTDGHVTSSNAATATVVNNPTDATTLAGTGGDDIIIATNGTEALSGGGGNDVLIGNAGAHLMTGGSGDDIFAFRTPGDGPDTIADFNNTTENDLIAIEASGFGGVLTPGMDVSSVFESSADNEFQSVTAVFHYDTSTQTLYYSPDGTIASEVALATLQLGAMLHANDLVIV